MKVIRQHDEFVKFVLFLIPILNQSLNEECRGSLRLKEALLLKCGRGHKVSAVTGCPAVWDCHNFFRAKARL